MKTIDVGSLNSWQQVYADVFEASPDRLNSRFGNQRLIDPFDIPFTIDSFVVAVSCLYLAAPTTWYNAGQLVQVGAANWFNDPLLPDAGNTQEVAIIQKHNVNLNQSAQILFFTPTTDELRLGFTPRPWIPKFTFILWKYTGAVEDEYLSQFEAIRAQLAAMQSQP